jgi:hypothetical protein
MDNRCKNCMFYGNEYPGRGKCRRYPPQRTSEGVDFPVVDAEELCGEYRRQAEKKTAGEKPVTIFTTTRLATPDEIAAEIDRRGAVIERLETNLRHWREECGKLHSSLAKAKEALELAIAALGPVSAADYIARVLAEINEA